MSKILYFDILAGISGDMSVGALIDLLDDNQVSQFKRELEKLNLDDEYSIEISKKSKQGIFGTKFDVILKHDHHHDHHDHHEHSHGRNLHDIEHIIDSSDLSDKVKYLSKDIFMKIASAESKIHGKSIEEVHFHEVGAIDSIIDIVGVSILIDILDIHDIRASKVSLGTGFVKCAHGLMPVPVPATLEILKGVPTFSTGIESELVTPTGAAIIKTLVTDFGKRDDMTVLKVGYGLGTKDLEIANLLRVYIAEIESENIDEELYVLETNIDDMSSEVFSHLYDKLFSVGALDVYTNSIFMKKNRPGVLLSVLVEKNCIDSAMDEIFRETSTFGIRKSKVLRTSLKREFKKVQTKYGEITVKIGYFKNEVVKIVPEYEDVKNIATKKDIPFIEIYNETVTTIRNMENL